MKTFKEKFRLSGEPEDVFAALTNPFTIELWTGYPAQMSTEAGSEFLMWEGDISGKIIEVVEPNKVVQQWYFGDQKEESIVTMKLFFEKRKTTLHVEHTNIPDDEYEDIVEGWREYYIGGIQRFLEIDDSE